MFSEKKYFTCKKLHKKEFLNGGKETAQLK